MGSRATSAFVGLCLAAASVPARSATPPGPGDELPPSPNVLVKVGADCVTTYGVQREVSIQMRGRDALRRKLAEAGDWTEEHEAKLAGVRAALAVKSRNELVTRALMAEIALEAGYRPNERQLERRLRAAVKKAGSIEALVRQEGRSLDGIREQLRLRDLQGRFFRNFVPQGPAPGPREIREHYEANRSALKSPPTVRVRIIFVSSASDRKAAFEKADGLKRELRYAPDRFALRARERSDHKESAERGGLVVVEVGGEKLDWVPLDALARMNPVVAQVAQKLQPGRVSEVVPLADGFLLVKLEGFRKGRELALAEVVDRITRALARETENRLIEDWMDYYLRRTYLVDGQGRRVGDRPGPGGEGDVAGRAEALLKRGLAHAKKGDWNRAIADLTKAIELKPDFTVAYTSRGAAYGHKGDYDRAIADLTKAIEIRPDFAEAYGNRGIAYGKKGQHDRAMADYAKAIELKPDYPHAFYNRGRAHAEKGDFDRAIADYTKTIELRPRRVDAYYNRGVTYQTKGDFDRAIADYTRAIELKPDHAKAYANRGMAYGSKGDHDRAIADLTRAIELNPADEKAYNNLAIAYGEKGDLDRAISGHTRAIELKPAFAEAYYNRGKAYDLRREFVRAIADYTKAVELKPDFAAAYYNRGRAYLRKGDLDLAIADFTKAIELRPGFAKAYSNRGIAYTRKGDLDRAILDDTKAIELKPDDAEAYYDRGLVYLKKGDLDRAVADFTRAIKLVPGYAKAHADRGATYAAKGDLDRARRDFEKAIKLDPDGEAGKRARRNLRRLEGGKT